MPLKNDVKQHYGDGKLWLQETEFKDMNICPQCHYETHFEKTKIKKIDSGTVKIIMVFYCENCKEEVYQEVFFDDEIMGIYISTWTKSNYKKWDESDEGDDSMAFKKLPVKPIMLLNNDFSGFVKPELQIIKEDE